MTACGCARSSGRCSGPGRSRSLIIVDPDDHQRMIRALDMGVNDYLMRPIDRQELLARANTQIRRSRFTTRLRDNVQQSMELAVTDALTGSTTVATSTRRSRP